MVLQTLPQTLEEDIVVRLHEALPPSLFTRHVDLGFPWGTKTQVTSEVRMAEGLWYTGSGRYVDVSGLGAVGLFEGGTGTTRQDMSIDRG